jgi:hypothetical protein
VERVTVAAVRTAGEQRSFEMALYLIAFNDGGLDTSTRIAVAVGWPQEVHRFSTRMREDL